MKTLLLDATALGPAGSRRLVHCAKIKNGTGGSIVMHVFKGKGACHRCRMRAPQSWL
jgi:hypothetical protein